MKIKAFAIYRYTLAFKRPVVIKGHKLLKRNGFIAHITTSRGHVGFGETAPLPGLSHESEHHALTQLKALRVLALNSLFPDTAKDGIGALEEWLVKFKLFPSVRFGIETAMLNTYADARKVPLAELFGDQFSRRVFVNALLDGSLKEVVAEAKAKVRAGWRSLKVKVGRENMTDEARKIRMLQEAAGSRATLRIDANCAFTLQQAAILGIMTGGQVIDYFEEPLQDASLLPFFVSTTGLPVALDEHVSGALKFKGIKALVLKPAVIGGILRTLDLIRFARAHNIAAVISSSFESGIGLTALANLASLAADTAAGLDTQKYFKTDLLKSALIEKNGTIPIQRFSNGNLRTGLLKAVHG